MRERNNVSRGSSPRIAIETKRKCEKKCVNWQVCTEKSDELAGKIAVAHFSSNCPKPRNKIKLRARVAELHVQLDETSNQLQNAKFTGVNSEETAQLAKENELLRNIVVRERQEEARRYQAKEQMLAELDKLKIKSDALNKQIELLAEPVTRLTSEELALGGSRTPIRPNPGIEGSFILPKKPR